MDALQIQVIFNNPLPVSSPYDIIDQLILPHSMQTNKNQNRSRLEFKYALTINKQKTMKELKQAISKILNLNVNKFKMKRSSSGKEIKDMSKTIQSQNIVDGGIIYIQHGIPCALNQINVTFSLYDPTKTLTDPYKKKRSLKQKLFQYSFNKNIKVTDLKKEVVNIINTLFPLYRGKYYFLDAIKVLKEEEKQQQQQNEINANIINDEQKYSNKNHEIESKSANIFGIEYIRLRKQSGAKVKEMLFDNTTLSQQILRTDNVKLVIEKIPNKEHFTKDYLCFYLQHYRMDKGKSWKGKLYRKKEFIIQKHFSIIELKTSIIAKLLRDNVNNTNYYNKTLNEIAENISIAKGFACTPMNVGTNINRLAWIHRKALNEIGIDPDEYFYKLKTYSDKTDVMRKYLSLQNDEIISKLPFYLRNGDVIVWTDITCLPNEKQIQQKQDIYREQVLKKLDLWNEYLVFGFIRKIKITMDIPEVIINLFLLFYVECDNWNIQYDMKAIEFDKKYCIIKLNCLLSDGHIVFLKNIITAEKYNVFKWKFRIIQSSPSINIGIYIAGNKFKKMHVIKYGFCCNLARTIKDGKQIVNIKYGVECVEGDIIEMIVDFILLELKYKINGTDYGKAFDIEKSKYVAGVFLNISNDSIQLL
eukprot:137772_1